MRFAGPPGFARRVATPPPAGAPARASDEENSGND